MRRQVALGSAVLAVAACSTGPTPQPQPSVGTLSGHILRVGGPMVGDPVPMPGKVTITSSSGSRDVIVGDDGAYSVPLTPGRYSVLGHSPLEPVGSGQVLPCPGESPAVITVGETTTVDAICVVL